MDAEDRAEQQKQIAAAATRLLQAAETDFSGFNDLLPFAASKDDQVCVLTLCLIPLFEFRCMIGFSYVYKATLCRMLYNWSFCSFLSQITSSRIESNCFGARFLNQGIFELR